VHFKRSIIWCPSSCSVFSSKIIWRSHWYRKKERKKNGCGDSPLAASQCLLFVYRSHILLCPKPKDTKENNSNLHLCLGIASQLSLLMHFKKEIKNQNNHLMLIFVKQFESLKPHWCRTFTVCLLYTIMPFLVCPMTHTIKQIMPWTSAISKGLRKLCARC
jgi:hypothetical protein